MVIRHRVWWIIARPAPALVLHPISRNIARDTTRVLCNTVRLPMRLQKAGPGALMVMFARQGWKVNFLFITAKGGLSTMCSSKWIDSIENLANYSASWIMKKRRMHAGACATSFEISIVA